MALKNNIDVAIDNITKKIEKYNLNRKMFQDLFKKIKYSLNPSKFPDAFQFNTHDNSFVVKVSKSDEEGLKFAGVDGGICHRSLNYFDIALIRAVGVLFFHQPNNKPYVRYFPSKNPFPDILTSIEPLRSTEVDLLIGMWRMQKEIRCAISLLEQDLPDIIILDGSVSPLVDLREVKQSNYLLDQYIRLKTLYRKLYTLSAKNHTLLCGVVKDSRSAVLSAKLSMLLPHLTKRPELEELLSIDYRPIVRLLRDMDLLYPVLDKYERTFEFFLSYFNDETDHDLKDYPIHCFYQKTARYDNPLRVEFPILFSDSSTLSKRIASLIASISSYNREYGLPSVIIEADHRAKINEIDADILIDQIAAKIGHSSFSLQKRRTRTPFSRR